MARNKTWQLPKDAIEAALRQESRRADGRSSGGHRHLGVSGLVRLRRLESLRRTDAVIARVLS